MRGWTKDRDKVSSTLQDRVRAKVVKSVLDQVDFLTSMMAVANTEHLEAMVKYTMDPLNNPKPSMRVTSIKEYREVAETLYKIVAGATTPKQGATSPMFSALTNPTHKRDQKLLEESDDDDINILEAVVEEKA